MRLGNRKQSKKKESGAALLFGLTLVMILTIVVVSASRTTMLQQKMAANLLDKELAFQSAESALHAGETYVKDTPMADIGGDFGDKNGLFLYDKDRVLDNEAAWEGLGAIQAQSLHNVVEKPVYVIEELPEIETEGNSLAIPRQVNTQYFRVTSKAKGGTESSLSVLQSMYKK